MYVCMHVCVCMYVCNYVSMYQCMHVCKHKRSGKPAPTRRTQATGTRSESACRREGRCRASWEPVCNQGVLYHATEMSHIRATEVSHIGATEVAHISAPEVSHINFLETCVQPRCFISCVCLCLISCDDRVGSPSTCTACQEPVSYTGHIHAHFHVLSQPHQHPHVYRGDTDAVIVVVVFCLWRVGVVGNVDVRHILGPRRTGLYHM